MKPKLKGRSFAAAIIFSLIAQLVLAQATPSKADVEKRVDSLLSQMTIDEKIAMIGDGYGGHFLPGGLVEELRGFARAIEKAVIRVDMQMNKLRIGHGS